MEKPIVRRNLMAMCESVATTCCYSLTGYSPASFTTTLHGGMLKGDYQYTYYVGDASAAVVRINSNWLNFTKGHATYEHADNCVPYETGGVWYIRRLDTNEVLTVEQARAAGIIDRTGYCPHENANCRYGRKVTEVKTLHVGATTPHSAYTENRSYLADHEAYQYSS